MTGQASHHTHLSAALRQPRFRRLLIALAVSQAGDWLYNLALLALVFERTHSSTWVALTTASRVAPIVVGGPLGGVLADRFDRRRLMVLCDVARAACMLALAAVAAFDLPVLLAPVLAALATAAGSPYPSCVAATTPRLVPDDALAGANAARVAVGALCLVAGPGAGAVLLLLGSTPAAFLVNAATFVVSAVLVLTLPGGALFAPDRADRTDPTSPLRGLVTEIADAVSALRAQPAAVRLVGADVLCSVVYGAQTVLLLLLARTLGLGDAGYGYLLAAVGLGGLVGTVLAGRLSSTGRPRLLLVGACLAVGVPATLMGVTLSLPVLLVCAAVTGAGSIVVEVAADTALQRSLAPEVLARAYGLAFPAAILGIVAGSLVAAPLTAMLGLGGALVAVGATLLAYAALLSRDAVRSARTARPATTPATSTTPPTPPTAPGVVSTEAAADPAPVAAAV
jgi:MFS family permease